jgi:hypothetical protein
MSFVVNKPTTGQSYPLSIGGMGGSGTRLVAEIAARWGFRLGSDLNSALDTLWFTLLFKRTEILQCGEDEFDLLTEVLVTALEGHRPDGTSMEFIRKTCLQDRPQHSAAWLRERFKSLLSAAEGSSPVRRWGWKEPNTHMVIERLWQRLPGLRYVHVVRHGLDMAYSSNQNQLRLWGPRVLGSDGPVSPRRSLAYWCRIHQRIQKLQLAYPGRLYWLDYDALCTEPERVLRDLAGFLDFDYDQIRFSLPEIRKPSPKHSLLDLTAFDPDDVHYVRTLGYAIPGTCAG